MKQKKIVGKNSYSGSGKLSDFKENGSWMINQLEKGFQNIERGIEVVQNKDGDKNFQSLHSHELDDSYEAYENSQEKTFQKNLNKIAMKIAKSYLK